MFAHPLWSVLILAVLVGLYTVVRIKHGKPLLKAYGHLKGIEWFMTWVIRFRSWIVNVGGVLLIALPDVIVAFTPANLAPLIGTSWAEKVGSVVLIFNIVNTAFRTKPDGQQA